MLSVEILIRLRPLIIGPPLQHLGQHAFSKGRTNLTTDLFYNTFLKADSQNDDPGQPLYTAYIDVRDCAALHVRSLLEGSGKNRRILLASPEPFFAQNILEILGKKFPQLKERLASVRAASIVANKEQDTSNPIKVDDSEAKRLFGDKIYRSLEDTVVDTTARLLELE